MATAYHGLDTCDIANIHESQPNHWRIHIAPTVLIFFRNKSVFGHPKRKYEVIKSVIAPVN
jgi:hypothetical protein